MKISAVWLLLTITLSFAGGGGAVAQEESADPDADCAAVLAAPPFVDMLTRDFGQLDSRFQGAALHGLEFSREELDRYFEEAGWEYRKSTANERPVGSEVVLQNRTVC